MDGLLTSSYVVATNGEALFVAFRWLGRSLYAKAMQATAAHSVLLFMRSPLEQSFCALHHWGCLHWSRSREVIDIRVIEHWLYITSEIVR